MLDRSPSQESQVRSPRVRQLWDIVKPYDRVAYASAPPQKPNVRTCFCGTTIMMLVLVFFVATIVNKWITGEPTVSFSTGHTHAQLTAPLPGVAIALCETTGQADVINESMFLKYVTPKFILRAVIDGFNRTGDARQTFMPLQRMSGTDCIPVDVIGPRCIAFCANLGDPAYKETVETLTRKAGGKTAIRNHTAHVTNNLKLQGKFGDPIWSWLEIMFDLANTDLSNMGVEFWKDTKGHRRDHYFNVYLKFGREEWKDSNVVGDGDWSWYIYTGLPRDWDPLPLFKPGQPGASPAGLRYTVELTHNMAHVGALRPLGIPVTNGFLGQEEGTTPTWFAWENYLSVPNGTGSLPYMASSTNLSQSLATLFDLKPRAYFNRTLIDVDICIGRHARTFKVMRPTLLESFIDVGAAYETALGIGVTVAFVASLLCQCKLMGAVRVLWDASTGNFAANATPQSKEHSKNEEDSASRQQIESPEAS